MKLDSIGNRHQFVGRKDSIGEPVEVIRTGVSSKTVVGPRFETGPPAEASHGEETYQYIQPTANPTPLETKRRGNSMTGAFTGISAVISPRQDMTEEITVPMRR